MNNDPTIVKEESADDKLLRLGSLKEAGNSQITWTEIADLLNVGREKQHTESWYRKRYRFLSQGNIEQISELQDTQDDGIKVLLNNLEKQRIRTRDERIAYARSLRRDARGESLLDLLKEEIRQVKPVHNRLSSEPHEKAIYAMLSDIHYGISFNSSGGKYNPDLAEERVMKYAEDIITIAINNNIYTCYVSLMGDLISGSIHQPIRIENREDIIHQVIGVSELVASFLYRLSQEFDVVYVNSVSGNHSRIDLNAEDALRSEKLDALVSWYSKARLEKIDNVIFKDNQYDSTISNFNIYGKNYIAVHGDMDPDLKTSALRIERMMGERLHYILAGHMHIPDIRIEDVGYLRNGSVCGSGDEYTMKKRLFGPPCQVCLIVSAKGVEAIHPVVLKEEA